MENKFIEWYLLWMIVLPSFYCEEKERLILENMHIIAEVQNQVHATGICLIIPDNISSEFGQKVWLLRSTKFLQSVLVPHIVVSFSAILHLIEGDQWGRDTLFVIPYKGDEVKVLLHELTEKVKISKFTWLLILDTDIMLEEFFADIDIPFDCEFLVAHRQTEDDQVLLTEVYRVSSTLPLKTYQFGNWIKNIGYNFTTVGFYERRKNLDGLVLKVGTINDHLISIMNETDNKPTEVGSYFGDAWKMIESTLKIKSDFYKSPDDAYGSEQEDGSWNGLVDMMIKNKIHVSNANFWWTADRTKVVKFIAPIFEFRLGLFIKTFKHPDLSWNVLLKPFSFGIWLCMAMSVVFLTLCLLISYVYREEESVQERIIPLISKSLLKVSGIFCNQAENTRGEQTYSRIVILTAHVTAVVILTSYSASLIACIVHEKYNLPFSNFQEFINDGTYELEVLANSAELDYFKKSRNKLMKKIYDTLIQPHEESLPRNTLSGVEKVCGSYKKAWFGSEINTYIYLEQLNCELLQIPEAYVKGSASMAIQENSSYLGILRRTLRTMHWGGLVHMLAKKYLTQKPKVEKEFTSVTVIQVLPIIIILLIGVVVSFFLILLEIMSVSKFITKRKNT